MKVFSKILKVWNFSLLLPAVVAIQNILDSSSSQHQQMQNHSCFKDETCELLYSSEPSTFLKELKKDGTSLRHIGKKKDIRMMRVDNLH